MVIGLGQICSMCLDSHASEVLARLLVYLVKASGKLPEFIGLASSPYNFWIRFHEYISRAVCLTRGRNTIATPTPTSCTTVTPLTSVHRVDAFPAPDNMCQSSDNSEDAFLGQLRLDFPDEAINAILLDQTTDSRSSLMDGQWCPSMTRHANKSTYSTPVTGPKRAKS